MFLWLSIIECAAKGSQFKLVGEFTINPLKKVYIAYPGVRDSAIVTNSKFFLTGKIDQPVHIFLSSTPAFNSDILEFYVDPSFIKLTVADGSNLLKYSVSGSKTEDEKKILDHKINTINTELRTLISKIKYQDQLFRENSKNPQKQNTIQTEINKLKNHFTTLSHQMRKAQIKFYDEFPHSYVTLYEICNFSVLSQDSLQLYFDRMTPAMKSSIYGQRIQDRLSRDKIDVGILAPNFKSIDNNGKEISLADYRGKNYVLLDFWASWCAPCRKGHPELIKLYSKYKERGLEIISISGDVGHTDKWKMAIKEDKIASWRHILNGTGIDMQKKIILNSISKLYDISFLPTKILIDKSGKIVKIIKAEDHDKLSEILADIWP